MSRSVHPPAALAARVRQVFDGVEHLRGRPGYARRNYEAMRHAFEAHDVGCTWEQWADAAWLENARRLSAPKAAPQQDAHLGGLFA